jgi:hypothetical protein
MKTTPRCYGEIMAEAAADGYDSPADAARAWREARAIDRLDDDPEPLDHDPGPYELPDRFNDR